MIVCRDANTIENAYVRERSDKDLETKELSIKNCKI